MAYLIVESGSNQGQQFEIHDEAVIGRHSSCDIVLAAAGMSRRQCRLFEDGGCYVVLRPCPVDQTPQVSGRILIPQLRR